MKKTQKSLISYNASSFQESLNNYLKNGWTVVPTTLVVSSNATTTIWCVVIEKETGPFD